MELICVSVSALFLTNTFDDYMGEGMIFEKWGLFVKDKFWLKPLGGCMVCTLFWITLLMFFLNNYVPFVWQILTVIGLSHGMYKIMNRYELL